MTRNQFYVLMVVFASSTVALGLSDDAPSGKDIVSSSLYLFCVSIKLATSIRDLRRSTLRPQDAPHRRLRRYMYIDLLLFLVPQILWGLRYDVDDFLLTYESATAFVGMCVLLYASIIFRQTWSLRQTRWAILSLRDIKLTTDVSAVDVSKPAANEERPKAKPLLEHFWFVLAMVAGSLLATVAVRYFMADAEGAALVIRRCVVGVSGALVGFVLSRDNTTILDHIIRHGTPMMRTERMIESIARDSLLRRYEMGIRCTGAFMMCVLLLGSMEFDTHMVFPTAIYILVGAMAPPCVAWFLKRQRVVRLIRSMTAESDNAV